MRIKLASRLSLLPPYLFAELDLLKREIQEKGVDVISLGIGDPDSPTPRHIVESLQRAAERKENYRYPDYQGLVGFREAAAGWYKQRFGVSLDPQSEVCALIGSKEGIANFPAAVVDPGDIVLIPDPGYPVYYSGCVFNGGEPRSCWWQQNRIASCRILARYRRRLPGGQNCCGSTTPIIRLRRLPTALSSNKRSNFRLKHDIVLGQRSGLLRNRF